MAGQLLCHLRIPITFGRGNTHSSHTRKTERGFVATTTLTPSIGLEPIARSLTATNLLKNISLALRAACGSRNGLALDCSWKGAAVTILVACTPLKNMVHGLLRT